MAPARPKTAERIPTCIKDVEKRLITNIEYTGRRKPIPKEISELTIIMNMIDDFCNQISSCVRIGKVEFNYTIALRTHQTTSINVFVNLYKL